MSAKHTPGPWHYENNTNTVFSNSDPASEQTGDGQDWQGVSGNDISTVCTIKWQHTYAYTRGNHDFPERKDVQRRGRQRTEANGLLVSAAPDLLAACHAAIELGFHGHFGDARYWERYISPVVEQIHAAIAKAEGRSES